MGAFVPLTSTAWPRILRAGMTLPIYLAAHLIYGVVMGSVLLRRMRAEGEIVGVPLVVTLAPVGLVTAPLGAVLLRYVGGWFLHGQLLGDGSVAYERFHLGLMIAVGLGAGLATLGGMFFSIAVLSRNKPALTLVPLMVALVVGALPFVLDGGDVVRIPGTALGGTAARWIYLHPAGLVSLAIAAVLVASHLYAKKRVATVLPRPMGPGSIVLPPMAMR